MPFLRDEAVSEVLINGPGEIYVERAGRLELTDARFEDRDALLAAINNVLQYTGKRMSEDSPLVDTRLPDGSRVHVVLEPLCRNGTIMTIRKFSRVLFDADRLVENRTWTPEVVEYLRLCVLAEKNILVAGGTSSGKTSLLNVLSAFVPNRQRIVVIEDSAELELQQDHVISLEARPADRWGRGEVGIPDLFRSSLRLRPDRVIIGEVRGGEALDMIQAMTSGHSGSLSTLHANSAADALARLETLAMMSRVELPLHALRAQIASAIDVVLHMSRFHDGQRAVTQVAEVMPLDPQGRYQLQQIYRYEPTEAAEGPAGILRQTARRSTFADEPRLRVLQDRMDLTRELFGPDRRQSGP
jgi:pilus assembly protein CpaF